MFNQYQPSSSIGVSRPAEGLLCSFAHRGLSHDDLDETSPARAQALLECGIACLLQTVPADEMDPLYHLQKALPFWVNQIIEIEQFSGWSPACPLRRLLEQQRAAAPPPLGRPQQLQTIQRLEQEMDHLASFGVPFQTTSPLLLEMAGLHRRASRSSSHAKAMVRQLQRAYSGAGDLVGMAHCELKLGDLASAPAGPPEYWGSTVRPGLDSTVPGPLAGSSEPPVPPDQIDNAASHYKIARLIFEQAGFSRGLATVELRHGYIATMRARSGDDPLGHLQEALRYCTYQGAGPV
jgi:hypothetical protein